MEQSFVDLRKVEFLVLDEADQMLDMGFIVPLRRIVKIGAERASNAYVFRHDACRNSRTG